MRKILLSSACWLFLWLVLVTPNCLDDFGGISLLTLPIELVLMSALLLLRGRLGTLARATAASVLALGLIMKVADLATDQVFARPFNPVFDAYLLVNGVNLLKGAIGKLGAVIIALGLIALALGFILGTFAALGFTQGQLQRHQRQYVYGLTAALLLWGGLRASALPGASDLFYQQLRQHASDLAASIHELHNFTAELSQDEAQAIPSEQLFASLKGKDVLLIFIESYGRTAVDNPKFAQKLRPLLSQATQDLTQHGLQARSAYLTSPTFGGISWLAHGTALSGLWINSQILYDTLVMSQRASLNKLFKRAGWRTSAVMPAITLAWPEGKYFGYDQIYTAKDLGYQGKPFNWITMPDQYTLAAYQRLERAPGHTPVMTEMALISSHAPWTPLPTLVPWEAVGDGQIFTAQTTQGDPPEIVWADDNRIREQFGRSIEYALSDLVAFANRYGDDNLVILALGDHQPAPLVTEDKSNRDVLVHLIARDPKVIKAVDHWHWSPGMLPADKAPVWPMDQLRGALLRAFSSNTLRLSQETAP